MSITRQKIIGLAERVVKSIIKIGIHSADPQRLASPRE